MDSTRHPRQPARQANVAAGERRKERNIWTSPKEPVLQGLVMTRLLVGNCCLGFFIATKILVHFVYNYHKLYSKVKLPSSRTQSVCARYRLWSLLLNNSHYMILDQIKVFKKWSTLLICGFPSAMGSLEWVFGWRGRVGEWDTRCLWWRTCWGGRAIRDTLSWGVFVVTGVRRRLCLWSSVASVHTPCQPLSLLLLCQSFELNYWSFHGRGVIWKGVQKRNRNPLRCILRPSE